MKNTFQKALSMALAIALLFTLAVNAFAEEHIEEAVVEASEPAPVIEEAPPAPAPQQEPAPEVKWEEPAPEVKKEEPVSKPADEPSPTSTSNYLVVEATPPPEQETPADAQPEVVPEEVADEVSSEDDVQPEETPEFIEAPAPTPEAPVEEIINGSVEIRLHGSVGGFQYGDIVIMEAFVYGYEGVTYSITWECSENLEDWRPVDGNNGDLYYAFTLNEENAYWGWRAVVETL